MLNKKCDTKIKSTIGGQALIEGIMMKGIDKGAMVCRLPSGETDLEVWEVRGGKNAPWYKKVPILRGVVTMITSMKEGVKYINKSSDKQLTEEDEEKSKFELFLEKKIGEKAVKVLVEIFMALVMIVMVGAMVGLFSVLPMFVAELLVKSEEKNIIFALIEGVVKIILLVGYMALTGLIKDIKVTYMYHGAEHKTIFCYENQEELTVENVRKQSRLHPRCGTSFLLISFVISILVFSMVKWSSGWQRLLIKFALLPLVVGVAYEIIKIAGRYDNVFTHILSAPGRALQKITTKEPNDKQIEVAIEALKAVIPENVEEDRW